MPADSTDDAHALSRARGNLTVWVLLVAAGVTWGLSFSLMKIVTGTGVTPISITLWQALFSIAMLLVVLAVRRRPLCVDAAHLRFYIFCGITGTALPSVLFFYAAYHLSAGVLSITISTVPLITFALAVVFRADRYRLLRIVGVVLGIVAVSMIVFPETSLPDRAASLWVLVSIAAASSYAVENVYIALRRPPNSDPIGLLLGMAVVALCILVPMALVLGEFTALAWPPGRTEITIFAMAAINVICYGAFIFLVTRAGPVFASQMAYVVTLSGVFWGIGIFAERHSVWIWGALVVMMVGLALVRPRSDDTEREPSG